jgi:tryptophan synthase alpha chain
MTSIPPALAASINRAKQARGIALMPFIAAGFPDLETSLKLLPALESAGAAAIEVGFPFSDPIADGPTIQEAFTLALEKKIHVDDIFEGIERASTTVSIPLVAMVSYSIVFRYGVERFAKRARSAGFAGLILPDLPPPEAESICKIVQAAGLDTVLLVSPSTPAARRKAIADLSSGFVYYLSFAGITGERNSLPDDIQANLKQLKSLTDRPVCVGFGISKPEHVRQLTGAADGAIVGSAFVRRIKESLHLPQDEMLKAVSEYCMSLSTASAAPGKTPASSH